MENVIEIAETSSQVARQVPEVIKSDVSLAASIYVSRAHQNAGHGVNKSLTA
jgi:hypothetical protein